MKINSEAIYGTKAWEVTHEGPTNIVIDGTHPREEEGFTTTFTSDDFWFTAKENAVYVIALEPPQDKEITVASLTKHGAGTIGCVSLLGHGELSGWSQSDTGLRVTLPEFDFGTAGYVLRVEI